MLTTSYFRVADQVFGISLPIERQTAHLLPSFRPFVCEPPVMADSCLFILETVDRPWHTDGEGEIVEKTVNDMGHTVLRRSAAGYCVELQFAARGGIHLLQADSTFTRVKAYVDWTDWYAGEALSSLVRIVYAQAVLARQTVSVHASAVVLNQKAYLFMGKSGTGKSTHAALWQRTFPGCRLLNDDNPALRWIDGEVRAYGTPWSGKTPCYLNESYSVGGIVRLAQAPANRFTVCTDIDAFVTLLPGCSVIRTDHTLYNYLCDTLVLISGLVRIGRLECLPNPEAAEVCANSLMAG